MNAAPVQMSVPLSQLVSSRRNPRKVKPARDAHHRLVALVRSQGLLQPLVVRKIDRKRYEVVAGHRRLAALKEIHRNDGDPKIACVLQDVDAEAAESLALGENFAHAPMHPLDEAEAFARLAGEDGKDAIAIASEFGVTEHYVRQRMKLGTLAHEVKAAYRQDAIDTATAEAFAAVPEDRQLEIWKELNGHPQHAQHVRNRIDHAWIDSKHALFDVSALPESAISRDLFGDRVLVERSAFMEAQNQALELQRQPLAEEGWAEIIVGRREDVQDRLYAMNTPEREFDELTRKKLEKLDQRRAKLEAAAENLGEGEEAKLNRLQERFDDLEAQAQEIVDQAPEHNSEAMKSMATVFLLLAPDGQVRREIRVPKQKRPPARDGAGTDSSNPGSDSQSPRPPTPDDLSDKQLAAAFTHQVLAVREALLGSAIARKRVLAMILHDQVRSEALSIRHEPNGVTLHASEQAFTSPVFEKLKKRRAELDPLHDQPLLDDPEAYERFSKLSSAKLDALIDLLVVSCLTAHPLRRTGLVAALAKELKVDVRKHWRPDAAWLSGYRKIQLAHLIVELKGPVHAPAPERKKSELIEQLAMLFTDAAEGKLSDDALADRVNRWLPSNLREEKEEAE